MTQKDFGCSGNNLLPLKLLVTHPPKTALFNPLTTVQDNTRFDWVQLKLQYSTTWSTYIQARVLYIVSLLLHAAIHSTCSTHITLYLQFTKIPCLNATLACTSSFSWCSIVSDSVTITPGIQYDIQSTLRTVATHPSLFCAYSRFLIIEFVMFSEILSCIFLQI